MKKEISSFKIMNAGFISKCQKFRHYLTRKIDVDNDLVLTFIMLNPSTADEKKDDPTLRKCMGFCERLGYGNLIVVNLFDYRATDPKQLKIVSTPCSEKNMDFVKAASEVADKVICAWGVNGTLYKQNEKVLKVLAKKGIPVHALDITKHGHPKHPLYISYEKTPVFFRKMKK